MSSIHYGSGNMLILLFDPALLCYVKSLVWAIEADDSSAMDSQQCGWAVLLCV
jgi:hypothetical protein